MKLLSRNMDILIMLLTNNKKKKMVVMILSFILSTLLIEMNLQVLSLDRL